MDLKSIHQSKTIRGILIGLSIAVIVLAIFQVGVFVGYRRAGGYGVVGKITKLNLPNFIMTDPDHVERVVVMNGRTVIQRHHMAGTSTDLRVDDFALVLGSPSEDGQIEAKFIRVR